MVNHSSCNVTASEALLKFGTASLGANRHSPWIHQKSLLEPEKFERGECPVNKYPACFPRRRCSSTSLWKHFSIRNLIVIVETYLYYFSFKTSRILYCFPFKTYLYPFQTFHYQQLPFQQWHPSTSTTVPSTTTTSTSTTSPPTNLTSTFPTTPPPPSPPILPPPPRTTSGIHHSHSTPPLQGYQQAMRGNTW